MRRFQQPSKYRRIALVSAGVAIVLVIGGSVLVWAPNLFATGSTLRNLGAGLAHLGGARLSVKVDRGTLPADGFSQTKITVVTNKSIGQPDARVVSGGGTIDRHPENLDNEFVYTAGLMPGTVEILVEAGSLSDQISLTLTPGSPPKAAILVAPPDNSTTNNPRLEVAGTAPANSKIVVTTDGQDNTTTKTDGQGVFKATLEKPLPNGQHTIAVSVVNELGAISLTSNMVTVTLKADPVKVDSDNIRTSPSQIIAKTSFGLFVPASLNTERVAVELLDRTFNLVDAHGSSIFSANLPAPDEPGVYSGNLILYDAGGNPTRFDKLLRFTVVSQ